MGRLGGRGGGGISGNTVTSLQRVGRVAVSQEGSEG